ncbi:MAG: hypothetical protein ACMUIS_07175 [bacterium]
MHEHHHHEDVKKLEAGLPYLLKHNQEHVKDLEKWMQRARDAHQDAVADELHKILELSRQITMHFEAALAALEHHHRNG